MRISAKAKANAKQNKTKQSQCNNRITQQDIQRHRQHKQRKQHPVQIRRTNLTNITKLNNAKLNKGNELIQNKHNITNQTHTNVVED